MTARVPAWSGACLACLLLAASGAAQLAGEAGILAPPFTDPITGQDRVSVAGLGCSQTQAQYARNRRYALTETSNDHLALASAQQIVAGAGFRFEEHYVAAPDGFITLLLRIVNPLARRGQLRQPPLLMAHGGLIDMACYVYQSAGQHWPEVYPRPAGAGPLTSANRSLALTLANHGFDVWLAGTRGSNQRNQGHLRFRRAQQAPVQLSALNFSALLQPADFGPNAFLSTDYWNFSFDQLAALELPAQLERVLELTGAPKVSLLAYSMSTKTSLMMLSSRPQLAAKVDSYVCMAPVFTQRGFNAPARFAHTALCRDLPLQLGTLLVTKTLLSAPLRAYAASQFRGKQARYSHYKYLFNAALGPSAKYQTLLELPLLGHTLMPVGFMQFKHYCQQVLASDWPMYDFGPAENRRRYNSSRPPLYNVSDIHVRHWMLIWATNDNLATPQSIQQMLQSVRPKPAVVVRAAGFNHFDLTSAFQVADAVVAPALDYLLSRAWPGRVSGHNTEAEDTLSAQLEQHIPDEPLQNVRLADLLGQLARTLPPRSLPPEAQLIYNFMDSLQKMQHTGVLPNFDFSGARSD